jgi:hypothetical protein
MYGSEEQSHNALQRRRMNNLAIRPATIFLLASVSAFSWQISANSTLGCPPALLAAAGVSVAYVFVRTLPEMSDARGGFMRVTVGRGLPFSEHRVYWAALIGLLFFYGLISFSNWRQHSV